MDQKTHDKGLEIRKAVLGEAYVANALKNADDFNKPFQELVTEYCWGAIWGREELPRKTRSMLNLAMISILNRPHELRVHIKGALVNGVSKDEIREVFMQVACYAGIPAGVDSFRIAREVFAEMDKGVSEVIPPGEDGAAHPDRADLASSRRALWQVLRRRIWSNVRRCCDGCSGITTSSPATWQPIDICAPSSRSPIRPSWRSSANGWTDYLGILENHLSGRIYVAGSTPTVAGNISMIGYLMFPKQEAGFDFAKMHPAIRFTFFDRMAALPGWKAPYDLLPGKRLKQYSIPRNERRHSPQHKA